MKMKQKRKKSNTKKKGTRNNPFYLGRLTSFENFVRIPKRLILEYSEWNQKASE